jgi:hypothetical protein
VKKLIMLLTVTLLFAAYAGTAPFVSATGHNDADTAHWQAYDEGGEDTAACVVDGGDEYSLGDSTWIYNTDSLDFSDAETAYLEFSYMLNVADSNDFLAVYAVDYEPVSGDFDPDGETPLAVYDSSVGDWTNETLYLSDHLGEGDVYIVFYWESDASGVSDGVRLNDAMVYTWDGETYDWTQILYWNEDHSAYGPGEEVNLDLSDGAGGILAVDFHYNDAGWDWWAEVDQVVIADDSRAELINENFESWPPTDWTILDYESYGWCRNDTTGRTNYAGGSGYCAIADSDYWYPIDSHLITPPLDCSDSGSVDLTFMASYNDIGGGDYFEVRLGTAEASLDLDDPFDDLSDWTAVDEGEYLNVVNTSWGEIKATF